MNDLFQYKPEQRLLPSKPTRFQEEVWSNATVRYNSRDLLDKYVHQVSLVAEIGRSSIPERPVNYSKLVGWAK